MPQAQLPPTAAAAIPDEPEFFRLHAVVRWSGLGRSTIYRLIALHQFPAQVRLSGRAVGWRRADLHRWRDARPTVS